MSKVINEPKDNENLIQRTIPTAHLCTSQDKQDKQYSPLTCVHRIRTGPDTQFAKCTSTEVKLLETGASTGCVCTLLPSTECREMQRIWSCLNSTYREQQRVYTEWRKLEEKEGGKASLPETGWVAPTWKSDLYVCMWEGDRERKSSPNAKVMHAQELGLHPGLLHSGLGTQ